VTATVAKPPAPEVSPPRPVKDRRIRPVVVRGEGRFALLLLVPAAVVVFGVVLYPVIRTLLISLYDVDSAMPGDYPFTGLKNYTKVFGDPSFYPVLGHTAYFTLVSTAVELVLGLGVALLLNAPLRLRWLWRSLVVLPWALPTIVNGALWRWIYNGQYGVLNALLGTEHQWLGSPFLALNMVIVADVWKNTSIVAFFLLAG
jgi:multiple sugar transport system permease protein/N,N'-diacetylchitobiose transport system permease protein